MTMSKQLWMAILVSTLLALCGGLLASLLSARAYIVEQLTLKNIDGANALALALSQGPLDNTRVELVVAAMFDTGHYRLIRVANPRGETIVQRETPAGPRGAPPWFIDLLPIAAEPGAAQISQGWKQYGSLMLVSEPGFAYASLWQSATRMAGALLVAGLIAGYIGTLILRRLIPPLRAVVEQASAITQRRFVTILPSNVPELAQLANAMNEMVERLRAMFDLEASRLESARLEASIDPLTGLANRSQFTGRLAAALSAEASGGVLALLRIANLAAVNHRLGRAATDDLLRRVAGHLSEALGGNEQAVAGRLNGADFAVLWPGRHDAGELAAALLERVLPDASRWDIDPRSFVHVGAIALRPGMAQAEALAQADEALATAETSGKNFAVAAAPEAGTDAPRSAGQWSNTLQLALDRKWARIESYPLLDLQGKLVHWECPLRLRFTEDGPWQPAGRFIPTAERLGRTRDLDLLAVETGLRALATDLAGDDAAINLSPQSVADAGFRTALVALAARDRALARRLWLEIPESGAMLHLDAVRALCRELAPLGCRIGIEHFGREFSQLGRLHGLGLSYLKIDASLIHGIDSNAGNQAFLRGLRAIADAIGLKVFAEGVANAREVEQLAAIGFDGVTGPGIRRP
jgi:diguanylate cyclase (GGDEF)-like protein